MSLKTQLNARITLAAIALRGIGADLKLAHGARETPFPQGNLGQPIPRREWEKVIALIRLGDLDVDEIPDALCSAGFGMIADRLRLPGLFNYAQHLLEMKRCCTALCPQYPERWLTRLGASAPGAVWWNGKDWRPDGLCCDIPSDPHPWVVAVIGSRLPDETNRQASIAIGAQLRALGYGFVTGGAPGVDCLAATAFAEYHDSEIDKGLDIRSAMITGFHVLPVDGWGHERTSNLCTFSCNPDSASFTTAAAMERNQLIYGACDAAFVIQPKYREGGTWHGALNAHRAKLCPLIVVQHEESLACRALIAIGGHPFTVDSGESACAANQDKSNLQSELSFEKSFFEPVRWAVQSAIHHGMPQLALRI